MPRWKLTIEILVGFLWIAFMTMLWNNHVNDEPPFNAIWIAVATINTIAGLNLMQSAWKRL